MSKFKATKTFDYSVEEVFKGFMKITKREFPKFNEKNPVGIKQSRVVKENGNTQIKMEMEITKFEKDSVYEITSKVHSDIYVSRYTFIKIDEEKSEVTLEEEQYAKSFMSKVGVMIQGFSGSSKTKQKLVRMATGVTEEVELVRKRMIKNTKKAK